MDPLSNGKLRPQPPLPQVQVPTWKYLTVWSRMSVTTTVLGIRPPGIPAISFTSVILVKKKNQLKKKGKTVTVKKEKQGRIVHNTCEGGERRGRRF